ncbi:MAG: LLM class flavin-dependent oxidoreductase [Halobacteriales archaeon]
MDLGTGLFTAQRRPGDDRSFEAIYAEVLALAEAIDEAGLASAWVSEHHFADDGYLSGTMPTLGAMAAATDDVDLGTCIALAPLYDPVRLVEDAATVDLLSGGRMHLGLSIGYRDAEFEAFGVSKDERVSRTVDAVRLARAAWGGEPYDPAHHPIEPGTPITPPPAGDGPPILLGGSAKLAVRRAARLGDGWIAPSSLDAEGLRVRVEDIDRVREAEGLDGPFQIYVLRHGFVADTAEAAWEAMRPGYVYLQRRYASWYRGEPVDELPAARRQELRERAIVGPPNDVTAELRALADVVGEDVHVILRTYFPGIGTDRMRRTVHRLGDEVIPALP